MQLGTKGEGSSQLDWHYRHGGHINADGLDRCFCIYVEMKEARNVDTEEAFFFKYSIRLLRVIT